MKRKILLYGAGGYSGQRVVEAFLRSPLRDDFQLLLAGRSDKSLLPIARRYGFACRVFGLENPLKLHAALSEPGIELILNAAGPLAFTALALARAAVGVGIHYIDINGEADVYRRLDDLGTLAEAAGVTLISGAGHSATTSDCMLDAALEQLTKDGILDLGAIRIAFAHVTYPSRGSAETAWRVVREQVGMLREAPAKNGTARSLMLVHEPIGKYERVFDFNKSGTRQSRISAACTLVDLMTARLTIQRHLQSGDLRVRQVETYLEMPDGIRPFLHAGAITAPLVAFPAARRLIAAFVSRLPDGPNAEERASDRHSVVLEIEDSRGKCVLRWRADTPNPYEITGDLCLAVARGVLNQKAKGSLDGWRTPAESMKDEDRLFPIGGHTPTSPWRECKFHFEW